MADRRRRRSAAASAFSLAFPLGTLGTTGVMLIRNRGGLFQDLTLTEIFMVVGVIVVLWLTFWAIIAASRRGEA
jgi:hypothetical protein